MRYLLVADIAKKWNMSERSVRNYCAQGRVNGAFLTGKTWNIPENAEKPERINKRKEEPITLLKSINWNCLRTYFFDASAIFGLNPDVLQSQIATIRNMNVLIKALVMGLADFTVIDNHGEIRFAAEGKHFMNAVEAKIRKNVYNLLHKFDDRMGQVIQVYGGLK